MNKQYDAASKRMIARIDADPEIKSWIRVHGLIIISIANFVWIAFGVGYLFGTHGQASLAFWLGLAWVVALQVFWTIAMSKAMVTHHDTLTGANRPHDHTAG